MNEDLASVELQRARWRRTREPFRLLDPEADDFATGGLARFVEDVGVRMLILPSDPELAGEYDAGLPPRNRAEYAGLFEHATHTHGVAF